MSDDVIPASPSSRGQNNGRKFRRRRKHKKKSSKVGQIDDHLKNESVEEIYSDFSSHLTKYCSWFDDNSEEKPYDDSHSVQKEPIKFNDNDSPELQFNVDELKNETFTVEVDDEKLNDHPQIIAESEEIFSEDEIIETRIKSFNDGNESIKSNELSAEFQFNECELKEEPIKFVINDENTKFHPQINAKSEEMFYEDEIIQTQIKSSKIYIESIKLDEVIETQVKSSINCFETIKLSVLPPRLQFKEDELKEEPLKAVISDETLKPFIAVSQKTSHKDNAINEIGEIIKTQIKSPINCAVESTINDDQAVNQQIIEIFDQKEIPSASEFVEPQKEVLNQQILETFDQRELSSASELFEPQKATSNFQIPKVQSKILQNEPVKVPFNIDWIYEIDNSPHDKPSPIIIPNCSKFFASANALECAQTKAISKFFIQFPDAVQSLQSFKQLSSQQLPKNVPINDHDHHISTATNRSSQEINEALDKSIPHYFPELSQNENVDKTKNEIDYRSMLEEDQDWFNDIMLEDIENNLPKCDKIINEIASSSSTITTTTTCNNVHQMPIENTAKRKSNDNSLLSPQKSKILRESQRNNSVVPSSPSTSIRMEKNAINSPNFRKEIDDITRAFLEDENQNLTSWSQELATKSTNFDSNDKLNGFQTSAGHHSSAVSINSNGNGFQTAGGREIKMTEIQLKSSKVFKNVFKAFPINKQQNFNGFQSPAVANNKNENQMKALDIFKDIFNEFPIDPPKLNNFHSPAVVNNKNENHVKALDIFKDIFNEFPIEPPKYNNFQSPALVNNRNNFSNANNSMSIIPNCNGFQTAGGQKINTSENHMKSSKIFKNVFKAFPPIIEQPNCNGFQSPAVDNNKNENQMGIFRNELPIEQAADNTKNEFTTANNSASVIPNCNGFQTAGGRLINNSTENQIKATKIFKDVFKAFPMVKPQNCNGFQAATVDAENSISKPPTAACTIENKPKNIPNNNRLRRLGLGSRIIKKSENQLKTSTDHQQNCNEFQSPAVDKNAFSNANISVPLISNCNDFQTAGGRNIEIAENNLKSCNIFNDIFNEFPIESVSSFDTEYKTSNRDPHKNSLISSPCHSSTIISRNNGPLMTSTPITIVQQKKHQQIYSPGFTKELHEMTKALLDDEFEMSSDNIDQSVNRRSLKPTRLSTIFETIDNKIDDDNSMIPLTNDVIIERKNALRAQQYYDRTRSITPRTGTLYLKKLVSSTKMSLREFVDLKSPSFSNEINSSSLTIITQESIRNFYFNMIDHYPLTVCQENTDGIPLHDDISLIMNEHCQVGYNELKSAFYSCPYVDRLKVINSDDWYDNHLKWILWKFAAMEHRFSEKFHKKLLTPENVMQQLKYRYDRDVERSELSVIRRLCENSDRLLTYDHCSFIGFISKILSENHVELSDGWYAINCELDLILSMAMVRKKIQIGTKLLIFCTENLCVDLHGYCCSPLQIPSNVKLKLNANACRRVKWDTKLGYYNGRNTFNIKLNSINLNGGVIACIKVQVIRIISVNSDKEEVPCTRFCLRKRRQKSTIDDSQPNKSLKLNNKTSSPKHTTINAQLPMQLEICDINLPIKVYQLNINQNCKIINEKCTNTMINEHSIIEVTNLIASDIKNYEMLLVTNNASCIKLLSL